MIPLEIKLLPDGTYGARTDSRHNAVALWLEYDLGRSGGGSIAEFFADVHAFRCGARTRVTTGGDLVSVVVERDRVDVRAHPRLGSTTLATVDELIDVVLRWFDVTHVELAAR